MRRSWGVAAPAVKIGWGVIFTLGGYAVLAQAGLALEFDYINEARVTLTEVLEVEDGTVVLNVNEGKKEDDRLEIPFRFYADSFGNAKPPSAVFLDPSGGVTFADSCTDSPSLEGWLFAARNGASYLKMEGPIVRATSIDYNCYPSKKQFFTNKGELLWEKDIVGYPRVSPRGDYVAVFEVYDWGSKVTVIDGNGLERRMNVPCGMWHALSKTGGFILLGEPAGVPVAWPGGTTVVSTEDFSLTHLDPLFKCDTTGMNLRGQTLYGSERYIIQSGVFGHREVRPEGNLWGLLDSPEFERGIQVYDANGTKLWEKNIGEGSGREMNFFVSDNERFVAFFPGDASDVAVYDAATGNEVYRFDPGIPAEIYEGYLSNDGNTICLTYITRKRDDFGSGLALFHEGRLVAQASSSSIKGGRITGQLSPDGDFLLVTDFAVAKVLTVGY